MILNDQLNLSSKVLTTGLLHAEFALDEVLELDPLKPLYSDDWRKTQTHNKKEKKADRNSRV